MNGPAIVARFEGGPCDGDRHVLPHADDEWRVVMPPESTDLGELAGRDLGELPRERYLRGDVVDVDDEGRDVVRYTYAGPA